MVQPGQSLLYIINNKTAWVIANFKETQLDKMVVGEDVMLKVDGYTDYNFEGTVTSFSPATGLKFSLLHPDNATRNFLNNYLKITRKNQF